MHDGGRCDAPDGGQIVRRLGRPAVWALAEERCGRDFVGKSIRIVLTVAHLDHVPEHCDPENLLHLCQRCHLLLDRHEHARNAAETRRRRRASGDLFADLPDILKK